MGGQVDVDAVENGIDTQQEEPCRRAEDGQVIAAAESGQTRLLSASYPREEGALVSGGSLRGVFIGGWHRKRLAVEAKSVASRRGSIAADNPEFASCDGRIG